MRKLRLFCLLFLFLNFTFSSNALEHVIFDSDLSSDWDDVGDVAVLNALADLGEIEILACMASSTNTGTAVAMNVLNTYYGRREVPCGTRVQQAGFGGNIAASVCSQFSNLPRLYNSGLDCPMTVDLYRQVLASQPDHSVTIVTAGFLDNLQDLMKSGADAHSPLNGMDLVKQKVKLWACAGGAYPNGSEFNFAVSQNAANYVVNNWPQEVSASFVGFNIGQCVLSGSGLPSTPATNPVRYIYVDSRTNGYPHPTWSQIMLYTVARPSEADLMWDYVRTGYNTCIQNPYTTQTNVAYSQWVDDGQNHNQKYFIEKQRYPIQEALEALIMNSGWPKTQGTQTVPNQPSGLRAEVKTGGAIELKWDDNSWNETAFVIERKIADGEYTQISVTGTDVETYTDMPSQTSNIVYRVKARNGIGDSGFSRVALYEWTEYDYNSPSPNPKYPGGLYTYYNNHLRWNQGGDYRPEHMVLNENSTHGKNFTIYVHAAALGSQGTYYVYFFYQNINNWYRFSINGSTAKFEKKIAGTIQEIASGDIQSETTGSGSQMQPWIIQVSEDGTMKYFNYKLKSSRVQTALGRQEILSVSSENFAFNSGKIALGGSAKSALWQNFYFEIGENSGVDPDPEPDPTVPVIAVSPSSLNFGEVDIDATKTLSLTIQNTSTTATLNITSLSCNKTQLVSDWSGGSISAGGNQTVNISFSPTAAGLISGTITILSNASQSTAIVSVSGTGKSSTVEPPIAGGTIHYVKVGGSGMGDGSSWANAAANLQTTINSAIHGDTIFVAAGTYSPAPGTSFTIGEKTLAIFGSFSGDETSRIPPAIPDTLNNKTILLGNSSRVVESWSTTYGLHLQGFCIEGGHVSGVGAGIRMKNGTISYCTVTGNTATSNLGGGIYAQSGIVKISNCLIERNSSGEGGGLLAEGSSVVVDRCVIKENISTGAGGGVKLNTSAKMTNCLVVGNQSSGKGGGIRAAGNAIIYNSTIVNNKTVETSGGGGLSVQNTTTLKNSIVWDNTANGSINDIQNTNGTREYCIWSGGSGTGNKSVNPLFSDVTNGDYRLQDGSPAIDSGDNIVVDYNVDLDGKIRIINSTVDIGAYEFGTTTGINSVEINQKSVWSSGSTLFIHAERSGSLFVYNVSGLLHMQKIIGEGLTIVNNLPKGIYITKFENSINKIIIQ